MHYEILKFMAFRWHWPLREWWLQSGRRRKTGISCHLQHAILVLILELALILVLIQILILPGIHSSLTGICNHGNLCLLASSRLPLLQ